MLVAAGGFLCFELGALLVPVRGLLHPEVTPSRAAQTIVQPSGGQND